MSGLIKTLNDVLALADDQYVEEKDLARAEGKTVSALRTRRSRRKGPPAVKFGGTVYYRVGALRAWLLKHEQDFDKAA